MEQLQKELDNFIQDTQANISRVKTPSDAIGALLAVIEDSVKLIERARNDLG